MTSSRDWDGAYSQPAAAPWDIGRPQPRFVAAAESGLLRGSLLDAGCGSGEHTLLAATRGAVALGVDVSATAIELARAKARDRGVAARFEVGDLLEMELPSASYDVVLDSGVFHVFDDSDRQRYVDVLRDLLRPGGVCCLMCFSERQPGDWGPRRVTKRELTDSFADGFTVERIDEATFDINPMMDVETVIAWFATIRRGDD